MSNLLHLPLLAFFVWLIWRKYRLQREGHVAFDPLRFFKWAAILALLGLAGCASHEKLAVASGPVFPLNPDHWQATATDLAMPDSGK